MPGARRRRLARRVLLSRYVGFVFTVRGPVAPEGVFEELTAFSLAETPVLAARGIRQHINFPMDISCYPLPEAMEYIRNLARMHHRPTFQCLASNGWYHFDQHGYQVEKTRGRHCIIPRRTRSPIIRTCASTARTALFSRFLKWKRSTTLRRSAR